jgi:hypothetical protein
MRFRVALAVAVLNAVPAIFRACTPDAYTEPEHATAAARTLGNGKNRLVRGYGSVIAVDGVPDVFSILRARF